MKNIKRIKKNNSGFIIADFLFAFTLVISIGIFIFSLTFSLATIEVAQYIVWSTARSYASANTNEQTGREQATRKFENLIAQFPLLTNSDGTSGWFELSPNDLLIGELDENVDPGFNISPDDKRNDFRQPWTGVSAKINLKLFSGLRLPFLGPITEDRTLFKFPVRAFIIRNVSEDECKAFFTKRYEEGIKTLESGNLAPAAFGPDPNAALIAGEDNGC